MKKSNWIILAIAVVISAFLLWLWYFLGFNRIDNPLDLVLSIIWWVVVAVGIFAIWKVEQARRRRIRTVYVGPKSIFNAEAGMVPYADGVNLVEESERILNNLKYNFEREDLPEYNDFPVDFIIRTDEYKDQDEKDENRQGTTSAATAQNQATTVAAHSRQDDRDRKWKGEVVFALTKEERPFENKAELVRLLNTAV